MNKEDDQRYFGHNCTDCYWEHQCRPHTKEDLEKIMMTGCLYYDPITINYEDTEIDRWIESNRYIFYQEYEEYISEWE